jgi:hypothetical protein
MERLYKGSRIRIFNFWRCLIIFFSGVSRQLLQVGEPAQRTGFSVPLWLVLKKILRLNRTILNIPFFFACWREIRNL